MFSITQVRNLTQRFFRRDFQPLPQDDNQEVEPRPRSPIIVRFRQLFGNCLPLFTYIGLVLILSILGSLPPITSLLPHENPDSGPFIDRNETINNSTFNSTIDSSQDFKSSSRKSTSIFSWFFPSIISILFLYSMFIVIRIFRAMALSRQAMLHPPPNQIRLNQFFTQLTRMENNGERNGGENWRTRLRLAMMNRDFTADDYEVLMRLDEGLRSRGATESSINRLPLRKLVHSDIESTDANVESASALSQCAICLAPYQVGDEVRTVLCMHQFHMDCIDPWLRSNGSCPVCKSRATEAGQGGDE